MKTSLLEKIKFIEKSTEWEFVGNYTGVTEGTNSIEFWIPWDECGTWSSYEEAFANCIEMDDKCRARWEYSKEDLIELYENQYLKELHLLEKECREFFKEIFNAEITNEKFIKGYMDIVACDSDFPNHNDFDLKIGLFNLFNQILNNLEVEESLLDKLEDSSEVVDMIANINYKSFNYLLEYGEDFEALVLSKLNKTKDFSRENVETTLKNSLVRLQANWKRRMRYIDALNLINKCLECKILHMIEGGIPVYRKGTETSKEGWYLTDKEDLIQELMNDAVGQDTLTAALKDMNIQI